MSERDVKTVFGGFAFFPRGGSAPVAGAFARELALRGFDAPLLTASRSDAGPNMDARVLHAGLERLHVVDLAPVLRAPDPLLPPEGVHPFQASYEQRAGAPDPVFAALDDVRAERQASAWETALRRAGAPRADILQLHHLTPLHEAARRAAPGVPVVTHLHGTELLMLEALAEGAEWPHAQRWRGRLRTWARRSELVLAGTPAARERAIELLGVSEDDVAVLVNGTDVEHFAPQDVDRATLWQRVLIDEPRGAAPGGEPGSWRSDPAAVARLSDPATTVLIAVGRFTAVKRLDLLIEAVARARRASDDPIALVLVGGHPGELEGLHPAELAARAGLEDFHLAGWHDHDELPELLGGADVLVHAGERESFGQVMVEALACGLPVIAPDAGGAAEVVDPAAGWLVTPGDATAFAMAVVCALDPDERAVRARRARESVVERYSWQAAGDELAALLGEVGDDVADGRALTA